jgi:hypothetical protein
LDEIKAVEVVVVLFVFEVGRAEVATKEDEFVAVGFDDGAAFSGEWDFVFCGVDVMLFQPLIINMIKYIKIIKHFLIVETTKNDQLHSISNSPNSIEH